MHRRKRILSSFALSFALILILGGPAFGDHLSIGENQQHVKRLRANFVGTFVNTTLDMNGDGAPALRISPCQAPQRTI